MEPKRVGFYFSNTGMPGTEKWTRLQAGDVIIWIVTDRPEFSKITFSRQGWSIQIWTGANMRNDISTPFVVSKDDFLNLLVYVIIPVNGSSLSPRCVRDDDKTVTFSLTRVEAPPARPKPPQARTKKT